MIFLFILNLWAVPLIFFRTGPPHLLIWPWFLYCKTSVVQFLSNRIWQALDMETRRAYSTAAKKATRGPVSSRLQCVRAPRLILRWLSMLLRLRTGWATKCKNGPT